MINIGNAKIVTQLIPLIDGDSIRSVIIGTIQFFFSCFNWFTCSNLRKREKHVLNRFFFLVPHTIVVEWCTARDNVARWSVSGKSSWVLQQFFPFFFFSCFSSQTNENTLFFYFAKRWLYLQLLHVQSGVSSGSWVDGKEPISQWNN